MPTNAKLGNDMLLQVADAPDSSTYVTVGALRATSITLNKTAVDITNKDSAGFAESMAGGGVKSASISGNGIFVDDNSAAYIAANIFGAQSNQHWKFKIIHTGNKVWEGYFNVDSFALSGDANDAETYEITLSSSDVTSYTTVLEVPDEGGGAPNPEPEVDLRTTLTVNELNALLTAAALTNVDTATFDLINASDEAQYNVMIGAVEDIVYVAYDENNVMVAYYTT